MLLYIVYMCMHSPSNDQEKMHEEDCSVHEQNCNSSDPIPYLPCMDWCKPSHSNTEPGIKSVFVNHIVYFILFFHAD